MKLEQSFDVAAPLERVWNALIDVEQVAPCLPGAAVTGRNDDGTYNGTFTIKIGPTTASYAGKLEMENIDEAAHRATMQANGTDKRGQGGAKATIVSSLSEAEGGATRVDVATDYQITGRLARFGRGGMIEDISERLLREFAGRLQELLARDPAAGEQTAPPEAPEGNSDTPAPVAEEPAPAPEMAEGSPEPPQPPEPPEHPEPPQPPEAPPPPRAVPAPSFQPVEPFDAGPVVGSVVWARMRRNAVLPFAFAAGLVLALILFRRRGRR